MRQAQAIIALVNHLMWAVPLHHFEVCPAGSNQDIHHVNDTRSEFFLAPLPINLILQISPRFLRLDLTDWRFGASDSALALVLAA